jgi:small conductance mechanosensitive channel
MSDDVSTIIINKQSTQPSQTNKKDIASSPSFKISTIMYTVLYVIVALLLINVMKMNVDKIYSVLHNNHIVDKYKRRTESLKTLTKNISTFLIWITLFASLFSLWNIDVKPLLAGLGIIGLSVGVGAQTYLRNIITGFFILLDQYYHIGDVVNISGVSGKVIDINLQNTVLENDNGEIIIIPNGNVSIVTVKTMNDDLK